MKVPLGAVGHFSLAVNDPEISATWWTLKAAGVEIEDPGDEIGPEGPGSPNLGLWFHDIDGYRWELSAQNAAAKA